MKLWDSFVVVIGATMHVFVDVLFMLTIPNMLLNVETLVQNFIITILRSLNEYYYSFLILSIQLSVAYASRNLPSVEICIFFVPY